MARKSKNLDEPVVTEIDGPAGLDLHPSPPEAVRVSKRAALVVLLLLCCLASVFGYGVYQRQHQAMNAAFSGNDPQNLVPATAAAKEITKDIPAGVINLATEADLPTAQQSRSNSKTPEPAGPSSTKAGPATSARVQGPSQAVQNPQPTPEQRQIAEAYGRELQAIAAPTAIRGNVGASSLGGYDSPRATSSDPSPLAALAQLLTPKTGTASDGTNRRATDREYEEQNMQAQKEAFLAQARKSAGNGYLPSSRVQPLSEYEVKAGWEIPAVLEQELNSDLPGELKALVTANVYDTATGRYLLIPQGARLVGTYDSNVAYGPLRVLKRRHCCWSWPSPVSRPAAHFRCAEDRAGRERLLHPTADGTLKRPGHNRRIWTSAGIQEAGCRRQDRRVSFRRSQEIRVSFLSFSELLARC